MTTTPTPPQPERTLEEIFDEAHGAKYALCSLNPNSQSICRSVGIKAVVTEAIRRHESEWQTVVEKLANELSASISGGAPGLYLKRITRILRSRLAAGEKV